MKPLRIYSDLAATSDALELLEKETSGHELVLPKGPARSVLEQAEADPRALEADVLFGQPDPELIAKATRLKWIQISSSGITRYDTPEFRSHLTDRGVPLCNSASVFNESCAAHTLSFMLAQARHLPRSLASRAGHGSDEWNEIRDTSTDLRGQTVAIVGYGAIGRRLAELLAPFRMTLYGCRRSGRAEGGVQGITPEKLHEILPNCDHVINILPSSSETDGFFDAARFRVLKKGAVFYNIGRGTTVDQSALLSSLQNGSLSAAWLDVTDPEPLPDDHPLRSQPNCHITPHVAGGHKSESTTLVRHFLDNFQRYIAGEPFVDRAI